LHTYQIYSTTKPTFNSANFGPTSQVRTTTLNTQRSGGIEWHDVNTDFRENRTTEPGSRWEHADHQHDPSEP